MRPPSAKLTKFFGIAALLAAVFLLMLFLDRFRFDSQSLFWHAARNFGHVPLFGVIAVIILWLLHLSVGGRLSALPRYAFAWIGAVGLGAISEYLQIASGRDADIMDWVYDIAGATAFLALHFTIDSRLSDKEKERMNRAGTPVRITALAILAVAGIPMVMGGAASGHRRTSFPKMYTFSSFLEKKFIESSHAVLEYAEPPAAWSSHDSQVAEVTFFPAKYPGLALKGPWPDWRDYQVLTLDVFSPAESSISLNLMIKDLEDASFNDRYNRELRIRPGLNKIRIQMADIENSPANRLLDLSSIQVIHLFVIEPQQALVLYFDDLLLE